MRRFLVRKAIQLVLVIFLVTLGTSGLIDLIPGSAAALILGAGATRQSIATLNQQLGLNKPFLTRYGNWVRDAFHGNLGTSIQTHESVTHMLATHLPVTLEIAILALVISLLLAIPVAMLSALHAQRATDRLVRGGSSALLSAPPFVLCVVLAVVLVVKFRWLPSFGWVPLTQNLEQNLRHAALTVIVLVLSITPLFVRVLRADLVAVLREDYVASARARGLPERYILFRHALRPASLSLLTMTGLVFGFLIGGSIILENYFSLPGLGYMVGQAIQGKDLAVVQGVVVLMSIVYVILNTGVDLGHQFLDPRAADRR